MATTGVSLTGAKWACESLSGGAGNDALVGLSQDSSEVSAVTDTLIGEDGSLLVRGSTGEMVVLDAELVPFFDTLSGGLGDDLYLLDRVGHSVVESVGEGVDTVRTSGYLAAPLRISVSSVSDGAGGFVAYDGDGNEVWRGGQSITSLVVAHEVVLADNVENLELGGNLDVLVNGVGNGLANVLRGNAAANRLSGLGGTDTLIGGGGDDTYVDAAADVVQEDSGAGTDVVESSATWVLSANVENLVLTGEKGVSGTGNGLANVLVGNVAGNTLNGGIGVDTMAGGAGDDTYVVDGLWDVMAEAEGEGDDWVLATVSYVLGETSVENVLLDGGLSLNGTGNGFDNRVVGNGAANLLSGGLGTDTLVGGGGNDTFLVDGVEDWVSEVDGGGTDTVRTTGVLAGTFLEAVEVSLVGFDFVENLELSGGASCLVNGVGNGLANVLRGNAAANRLSGLGGTDTLVGGSGNDTYVDAASDVVVEEVGGGVDWMESGASCTLAGNVENLVLAEGSPLSGTGNALANRISGNSSANILDGSGGIDTLEGGAGNDTYVVDAAGDVIVEWENEFGEGGVDWVKSGVSYGLGATEVENLVLTGLGSINGTGNALNNAILGNASANLLDGGIGADSLVGGGGNDTFLIDAIEDAVVEVDAGGTDTVKTSGLLAGALTDYADVDLGRFDFVENLELSGSASCLVNGLGNGLANVIRGNPAANRLNGLGGIDTLIGGLGSDTYVDATGDVVIEESGGGVDWMESGVSCTLAGNVEGLFLREDGAMDGVGNGLANTLLGNGFANLLEGGGGRDTLIGGAGDDTYRADADGDVILEDGDAGVDWVRSSFSYTLRTDNVENVVLAGDAAINGTGSVSDNVLVGNGAANVLDGGGGADMLVGGGGNDTFLVDGLEDVIVEGLGGGLDTVKTTGLLAGALSEYLDVVLVDHAETLDLSGSSGCLVNGVGNALANTIKGNAAANRLSGLGGIDTLIGGLGSDTYVDASGDVVIEESGGGVDWMESGVSCTLAGNVEGLVLMGGGAINGTGNALANTLSGTELGNVLDGSGGADTLIGGVGDDTYLVDSVLDVIVEGGGDYGDWGSEGVDLVRSSASYVLGANLEYLTLIGAGSINGTGNALGNVLTGNVAANVLEGGGGADTLVGALGNDTYRVDSTGVVVVEATGEGTDTVVTTGYLAGALDVYEEVVLSDFVENLELAGSGLSLVNGTGNGQANVLRGNAAGNRLKGLGGTDTLIGGLGGDTYVDAGGDVMVEEVTGGLDWMESGESCILALNIEGLFLTGSGGVNGTGNGLANTLLGNAAANVLDGSGGADSLVGGGGDDTYLVDNAADMAVEGAGEYGDWGVEGVDLVKSAVGYALGVNVENLMLTGSASVSGTGTDLANVLTGNSGANTLDGRGGDDFLDGGVGVDRMIGGGGSDTYVVEGSGDVVVDGEQGDLDVVISSVAYVLGLNVENLVLAGTGSISGTGNELANVLTGNLGANELFGGDSQDTLIGGAGDDTYRIDATSDEVVEQANGGVDVVASEVTYGLGANVEVLVLRGTDAIDGKGNGLANTLIGNGSANVLDGGSGGDLLNGGAGIDRMIGGLGDDTFLADVTGDVVVEQPKGGLDYVQTALSYTLGLNVEGLLLVGGGAVKGTGNGLNNTLRGNDSSNTLDGGAGNDRLDGGLGKDLLIGGLGNDSYGIDNAGDSVVEGANAGVDRVESSISFRLPDHVENLVLTGGGAIGGTGNALPNKLMGNSGANTLDGAAGADTLSGGAGNDTYFVDNLLDRVVELVGEGVDVVMSGVTTVLGVNVENLILTGATSVNGTGNGLSNVLIGNSGANALDGGLGDDSLDGGGGVDRLVGGAGNDTFLVDVKDDVVVEAANGGVDVVLSAFSYVLGANVEGVVLTGVGAVSGSGNALANTLTGNRAANTLDGGDGNDVLDGGGDGDSLIGGGGNDTYLVDSAKDAVSEREGGGVDEVRSALSFTLGLNVENLVLTGIAPLSGTGNSLANGLTGNGGVNVLDGGAGDDWLDGGLGADRLIGGMGNDTYVIDSSSDVIVEGAAAGVDLVESSVSYVLGNELENLLLLGNSPIRGTGNALANVLTGNAAGNSLSGGGGADTLIGGGGDDTYVVDSGLDVVVEAVGQGVDGVQSSVSYVLGAEVENLWLTGVGQMNGTGNLGGNVLTGNASGNVLDGAAGADTLIGGLGDDSLVGGRGGDSLFGGAGNDSLCGCVSGVDGGRGEVDTLTGGDGVDVFELGWSSGRFYDDGKATDAGRLDYALITDFTVGQDRLSLDGAAAGYFVGASGVVGVAGSGIFHDSNANKKLDATDELIAIVRSANSTVPSAANVLSTAVYV